MPVKPKIKEAKKEVKKEVKKDSNEIIDLKSLNLHQRIHGIMKMVTNLTKDSTIAYKQVSYKAVTEQKVTTEVRVALIAYGVTCIPEGNIQWNQVGTLNTVIMNYLLTNIDDPKDFLIIPTIGQGADTQDKGTNKAMTGAFKYLLLRTFNIPTGDDPDKESSAELDDKHTKNIKKKYEDLIRKNKDLYTEEEMKRMNINPKWSDAKIMTMTVKIQKDIESRESGIDEPATTPGRPSSKSETPVIIKTSGPKVVKASKPEVVEEKIDL